MRGFLSTVLLLLGLQLAAQTYQYRQVSATNGLSYNYVTSLSMDWYHRLWVGTSNGVNVISNGQVRAYTQEEPASGSASIGRVLNVLFSQPYILVATNTSLLLFDEPTETFSRFTVDGNDVVPVAMAPCGNDILVLDASQGALYRFESATAQLSLLRAFQSDEVMTIRKMLVPQHRDDRVLLVSATEGVSEYDLAKGTLTHIDAIPDQIRTSSAYLDAHDNLWLSPANSGVACYDIEDGYAQRLRYTREAGQLTDNDVLCITEANGLLFFGTDGGGINVIDRENGRLQIPRTPLLQSVTRLASDGNGTILAGTTHYGVIGIRDGFIRTLYDEYMQSTGDHLSNGIVLSMYEDPDYGIWLGTDGGGLNLYQEATGAIVQIPSTFGRKVNSICPYGPDDLLLMFYNEGVFLFNKQNGTLSPFTLPGMPQLDFSQNRTNYLKMVSLPNGDILSLNAGDSNYLYQRRNRTLLAFPLAESPQGASVTLSNFHVGKEYTLGLGQNGIYEINNSSLAIRNLYQNETTVSSICYTDDGECWLTDTQGVLSVHSETGRVRRLPLPANIAQKCSAVTADKAGNLWITVDGGILVHYDRGTGRSRYYSREDGVEEVFFNGRRGTLTSRQGNIFISGASGLMIISPDRAGLFQQDTPVQTTLLSAVIDDTPVAFRDGHKVQVANHFGALRVRIAATRSNPLTSHQFRYQLTGSRQEPVVQSNEEEYIIQNHAPGTYSLLVSTLTNEGWTDMEPVISFRVRQPLGLRWYMWLLYAFAAAAALFAYRTFRRRKARLLAAHEQQMQEKKAVEDQIVFMSNVAHELRTPLTLIYNPVKRVLERESLSGPARDSLNQVSHQVSRMTQMVNMVLDVQKMDLTNSSLFIEPVALNRWIRNYASDFEIELEEKGMSLAFDLDEDIGDINIDQPKIEVALSNLLMNAIKYSDSGTVTVRTRQLGNGRVRIAVSDQGRGFTGSPEKLFQRFHQADKNSPGYGIGLSYTRMLVEKHGGTVGAYTNDPVGSTFYFDLPANLAAEDFLSEFRLPSVPDLPLEDMGEEGSDDGFRTDTQTLLVVDNQENILRYIKSEFQPLFKHIYTALNGQEALEIIRTKLPSIVVSDVVMPVMSGFELCKTVKSDLSISHIPVILLTARDDLQNQEMGYKLGADVYVPKPFDIRMLYYVIRTQLRNRSEIKRQYATAAFQNSTQDLTFSLTDEKFMIKLNKFILDNLSDQDLDIDKVADHMCISRSTLFYKMNDLTGMSTGRYIRKLRINRAKEMLEKTDKSVNDISVMLGFAESRYFSTVFKQETGETPSQYKKRVRSKAPDA